MKLCTLLTNLAIASCALATTTWVHAHGVLLDSIEVLSPADGGLVREVSLRLKDGHGKPITAAELTLTADMPSMPMAHQVSKVAARAGEKPGTYLAKIPFEMRGEWAVKIEVVKPSSQTIVRKVMVK